MVGMSALVKCWNAMALLEFSDAEFFCMCVPVCGCGFCFTCDCVYVCVGVCVVCAGGSLTLASGGVCLMANLSLKKKDTVEKLQRGSFVVYVCL